MSLHVTSDLRVDVDGVEGRVEADGERITFTTADPAHVWGAAFGSSTTGSGALRQIASKLSEEGLLLDVVGPQGHVAAIGAGIDSVVGRVFTGSRHVQLGSFAALTPLAKAKAKQQRRPIAVATAATVVLSFLGNRLRKR